MGGVYVHIPFCVRKCAYCDFVSYPALDIESIAPAYLDSALAELRLRQDELHCVTPVRTLYIGGGTPTCVPAGLLAAFIAQLIGAVCAEAGMLIEVTCEANPKTVDRATLAELRRAGVNRLSLGFQSLADAELAALGRIHSATDCLRAYADARGAGFDNISIDLILGAPGQTRDTLERTITSVVRLGPEHLSAYCLSLEEGTPLADAVARGEATVPGDDEVADMYDLLVERMTSAGYARYEISSFAHPGFESLHNMGYWRNGHYIGLGVAAHSHCARIRSYNTSILGEYMGSIDRGNLPAAGREERTPLEEARDALMLGLRMSVGVDLGALSQQYGVDLVTEYSERFWALAQRGLVEMEYPSSSSGVGSSSGPRIRLAQHAFLLANKVFIECV